MSEDLMSIGGRVIFLMAMIAGLALILVTITQDHSIQNYQMGDSHYSSGYCVEANIPWEVNHKVFCSDDINKVIEVKERLNK